MKYIVLWVDMNDGYVKGYTDGISLILLCYVFKPRINGLVIQTVDKRDVQITYNDFFNFDGIRV